MKKEQIQEAIQKSFEQECRGYAFYAKAYNLMQAQIENFESEITTLEEKKETIEKALELKKLLSSKEFNKVKEKLKSVNTDDFIKEVSDFLDTSNSDTKQIPLSLKELYEQERKLINLRKDKQEILCKIRTSIHYIFDYVAENGMKLVVTRGISDVAYKAFVKYYMSTTNFDHKRNIIDMENSSLPARFVKAYSEKVELNQALEWFEKEAKKIKF